MPKQILCSVLLLGIVCGRPAWTQSTNLTRAGTLSHVTAGGSWTTTIWLINSSAAPVSVQMDFHADDGSALRLPLVVTQRGATQPVSASRVNQTIPPGTALMVDTGAGLADTVTGWVDVLSSGPVSGFAIFRSQCAGCDASEGTVPLQNGSQSALVVPYDNTQGFVTGIALANLSSRQASVTTTVWDEYGNRLTAPVLTIPANGHTSFAAPGTLPSTIANRGIVQFQNAAGGALDGLGLRFSPYGTFTSVPTVPQAAAPVLQISSLSPSTAQAGSTVTLVVNGSSLSGATGVQFTPSAGITVSNVSASATQVTATVSIGPGAAGQVNVSISSPSGVSNALPFTVQTASVPRIASVSPNRSVAGSTLDLSISGQNLSEVTDVRVSPSGTGIYTSGVSASSTYVTLRMTIPASASAGQVSLSVIAPSGTSNTLPFTIESQTSDGQWSGTTSQYLPVSLTVANNRITAYSYKIEFPAGLPSHCPTGVTINSGPSTSIPITGGSFSTSTISGSFQSSTSAGGTIVWTLALSGCSANGSVSWTASRR